MHFHQKVIITILSFQLLICNLIISQHPDQIFISDDGVMHWSRDSSEVTGFGENYTVPFAYGYRAGKRMGVDLEDAIDQDVYQFARLGLDLFRVHVWDCEISDTLGNLLDNEHLQLFDYLLWKLKLKGINAIITPIAYWGNGWPEKDEPTPGFATKFGKDKCLTNPEAIKAQENYLSQFVNHVNRYTGIAYKNETQVLAFEVCNEPHHRGSPAEVTAFVKKMKDAIRSTGCTKPVFYNVSHSVQLEEAYYNAGIDGGTFQWYPTGLVFGKELGGNMLPNVDRYQIPFDNVLKQHSSARFVYEFDAADMSTSYMYPAMARSFRTAGMQLATHFAYDPTYTAPYNTEYNTHYMNLFYAPQKALSLMICAEVFRQIPLYSDYGAYPGNTSFGPFRVSYEENLAEMVTDEKFIYTNNTTTKPPAPEKLELIAGWGNSSLVQYDGTGAYFLDKMGDGIWRLELMPDAIWVDNLFGRNTLDKTVAVVQYERRKIKFNLPGFEEGYAVESVDWRDSILYRETLSKTVELKPGIYLLMSPQYEQNDSIELQSKSEFEWDKITPLPTNTNQVLEPYKSARVRGPGNAPSSDGPVFLFDASLDIDWLNRQWLPESTVIKDEDSGYFNLYIKLNGLTSTDHENSNAPAIADYSIRHYFGDLISDRQDIVKMKKIFCNISSTSSLEKFPVQIALVMKDGSAFGGLIHLNEGENVEQYTLLLSDLKRVKTVLLPRPYPTFLPYYSEAGKADHLDLTQIESLQISIGPGIDQPDWGKTYEVMIQSVYLGY